MFMEATYTMVEIEDLIPKLDNDGLNTLRLVVKSEEDRYTYTERLQFYNMMMGRVRELWDIELGKNQ